MEPEVAAFLACHINRKAGEMVKPTPATRVRELIDAFPSICKNYYDDWNKEATSQVV
jgi:NAD(P)H-hydrate repair Nnr-like enzyme with NAD(P)H-hydrate dehydratase domain